MSNIAYFCDDRGPYRVDVLGENEDHPHCVDCVAVDPAYGKRRFYVDPSRLYSSSADALYDRIFKLSDEIREKNTILEQLKNMYLIDDYIDSHIGD